MTASVTVSITRKTKTTSRKGFGTPLIMSCEVSFPERVKTYTDPAGLLDETGIDVNSRVYKQALVMFSQSPKPKSFKVGRRANAPTQAVRFIPKNVTEGFKYEIKVTNCATGVVTQVSITTPAAATVAAICALLQTPLNAISGVTATDNSTDVECVSTAGVIIEYTGLPGNFHMGTEVYHADPGIAADWAAIRDEDDDFYSVELDTNSNAEVLALAALCEAASKLHFATTPDTGCCDVGDATDVMSQLKAASYFRTALGFYGLAAHGYLTAGWQGALLPKDPGRVSWAHKSIAGVAVDQLRDADIAGIEAKNGTYYVEDHGANITKGGKTAGGEWIDVMRLVDLLEARIFESVFGALINEDKIPFTARGISQVKSLIKAPLDRETTTDGGGTGGNLAGLEANAVFAPAISDVSAGDKLARTLTGMSFSGTLSGAIHFVQITGEVSV